jgi:proteasome lid subunit RPN8/RPN11
MIKVLDDIFNKILEHCKDSYPHECCGALLGMADEDGVKTISDTYPMANKNTERAKDRYEIDPLDFMRAEKAAKAGGLELLGIYHSHPDHPSRPSEFDRERGWPDYSYIIVAVENGEKTEAQSWCFTEDNEPFKEEELQIIPK